MIKEGWDGWMASPIQWTWTWVNSGKGRGRPDMLQSMGLQRVSCDLVTEQQQRRIPSWLLTLSFNCDINWSFETDSVVYWWGHTGSWDLIVHIISQVYWNHVVTWNWPQTTEAGIHCKSRLASFPSQLGH